ncbi:MAG: C25 family cysteine peptidase [Pirellulaceae bacterium]
MGVVLLTCLTALMVPPQPLQLTLDAESAALSDVAVVCAPAFYTALQPWIEHRQAQGHRITLVSNQGSINDIRGRLRQVSKGGKLRWVVLIGDAIGMEGHALRDELQTPTAYATATVLPKFGGKHHIATDNAYADLDEDGVPELAVGRITADQPIELAQIVQRIIDYEQQELGPWRRRVNLIAGVGGFGKLADFVLESATRRFLTSEIPAHYATTMTYGSWQSPYCPDPQRFHSMAIDRFNEGCLFWVYIGHGHRRYLDQVHVPGGSFHILDINDTPKLQSRSGRPISIFLACHTGAFDNEHDCMAEQMLRTPGGPIAVVAASRLTMPYAMAVLGDGMIRRYFHDNVSTLGEVLLGAKQQMLPKRNAAHSVNRQLLDTLAATFSPNKDHLADELREHVYLFNLIGDPLLRIRRPQPIALSVKTHQVAGGLCRVQLQSPIAGRALVEIVCRRDRLKSRPKPRDTFEFDSEALDEMQRTYLAANDPVWAAGEAQVTEGENVVELPIPTAANGPCVVRVYVRNERGDAIGSTAVFVTASRRR